MSTVGILGVVHDNKLRKRYHLTLEIIKELILEFNPDVICGEVLPDSWEKYKTDPTHRGYWGEPASEYWDLIFPLCEEFKVDFVPIDWVELDVWMDFDPFKNHSELQRSALIAASEQWFQRQLSTWNSSAIPFNSLEYDDITKQKYKWLEQINPESHIFRWECRHLIMIQRINNAINKHLGKRILCIVGADHNHAIYEGLVGNKDIQLVYPLK
ncbi:hypothetical protein HZF08_01360 [Paenibacillus sp. CGMCC 1.16610]|uniref:Uncharacterized protein n=1 Tax=Paenibacillus anseongense TaxID=2682845 RepID=A0ABW9TZK0_9BACL|nr:MULTISPECIES: hypothetical protein [Paenibacillus]MBA2936947.1 hypothetical protein [Paenibacillus sp. CGMCC 1.16610]MVQ33272.1 hypothetical protein [Paenibacillus anseongense]